VSFLLDVRDLVGDPGTSRRASVEAPVAGLSTELSRVPQDRPVRADVLIEALVEGLLVSGELSGTVSATCARCLTAFEAPFRLEVEERFVPVAGPGTEDPDAYPLPADGVIDLEPVVRDAVIPAMPFSPLCRPDCEGLCPRCGGDRNLGECRCGPEVADHRWTALADIEFPDEARERAN
jgi:uncharacterized protein